MIAYTADRYLDFPAVEALCRELAAAAPGWLTLEEVGRTLHGRPILLLIVTRTGGADVHRRPTLWLDAGTHAAEWTSVMAALYALSRWVEALEGGDAATQAWFSARAVALMPCIAPDGFQAMCEGAPYLRSTLRPPQQGEARIGLEPRDMDGDGIVRWMRWRHPAGPLVADPNVPLFMRPRTLDDAAEDAFFLAAEGELIAWDGVRWTGAPPQFGIDLNRNFPAHWAPFTMWGMDGGDFPLSEPESRAVVDAFASFPFVAAGLTLHTYTGCLVTQPYRPDSPLPTLDVELMDWLAREATAGTGYRVFRSFPDFNYDPKRIVVGVWADTMAVTFGVPGWTVELWDPCRPVGLQIDKPMEFFLRPEPNTLREVYAHFAARPGGAIPWAPFEHPQLGMVEIGGLDYMRTIRNPPVDLLADECQRNLQITDRLRRALPDVAPALVVQAVAPDLHRVTLVLENRGALSTAPLPFGASLRATPRVSATLDLDAGLALLDGPEVRPLEHLDGWAVSRLTAASNPVYAALPPRGHRQAASWLVRGHGRATLRWIAGRGGEGELAVTIPRE